MTRFLVDAVMVLEDCPNLAVRRGFSGNTVSEHPPSRFGAAFSNPRKGSRIYDVLVNRCGQRFVAGGQIGLKGPVVEMAIEYGDLASSFAVKSDRS